ncbi:MAG: hypothetical protein EXS58_18015 [Candidatus Latescibacteria bacterium]|nr:hypothetical protein [Candidatus Latescibacterota bacterium]
MNYEEETTRPAVPAPPWIITFADLMGLLMACFALMLSFSTLSKPDDFSKAAGSLQGALGVLHGEPVLISPIEFYAPIARGEGREAMNQARQELLEIVEAAHQEDNIEVLQSSEGIIIRIRDQAVFGSGQADIKSEALLLKLGEVLTQVPNAIEIGGHSDNIPIHTAQFPNNHWLSNARAMKVLDLFADEVGIDRARLSAIGYGEYHPLAPNDTPENRAQNRRVEIKVRYKPGTEDSGPAQFREMIQ